MISFPFALTVALISLFCDRVYPLYLTEMFLLTECTGIRGDPGGLVYLVLATVMREHNRNPIFLRGRFYVM